MKKIYLITSIIILCIVNILVFQSIHIDVQDDIKIEFYLSAKHDMDIQFFWSCDGQFQENSSLIKEYQYPENKEKIQFQFPKNSKYLRLDFGEEVNNIFISECKLILKNETFPIDFKNMDIFSNNIREIESTEQGADIETEYNDPYIAFNLESESFLKFIDKVNILETRKTKIELSVFIDVLFIVITILLYRYRGLMHVFYENKKLIFRLTVNDFKNKFAGSYFGSIWAFIQPLVTILVYWFVFAVGFRSTPVDGVPFVFWLMAGLIPWFFFSESWQNSTNSLIEYSYLVKKVVFKVDILPLIKIFSALVIHLFFLVLFFLLLFITQGKVSKYMLQVPYYLVALIVLVIGIAYFSSAIILFFKDFGQIIGIILQIGVWMTPIMWNYQVIPIQYQWIIKLNPIFYIVQGYRNTFLYDIWFWEDMKQTTYFWCITLGLLILGICVFQKLKVHFADVL